MRKVYLDLMIEKIKKGDLMWAARPIIQYPLIHLSFLSKKPLSGPILGTLLTNYTCNYHCQMCDIPMRDEELRKKGLKMLSTEQMKHVIKQFAELGVSGIGFTGGEPLLRKDIFELLKYTNQLGMLSHLNTNGYLLNNENIIKLFDSNVSSLNISLDGAKAETHDAIRGFKGSFEQSCGAIININNRKRERKAKLRVKIVCVISETNIAEIPDFLELGKKLQVDCMEFIPQQPFLTGAQRPAFNENESFYKKVEDTMRYLIEQKKKGAPIENSFEHIQLFLDSFKGRKSPLKCYAGYNSYGVDCYGEIYPCVPWMNWAKSVGNIKDMDLKEFWYSSKYNKIRAGISKCRDCYLNCQSELNILFNPYANLHPKKMSAKIKA